MEEVWLDHAIRSTIHSYYQITATQVTRRTRKRRKVIFFSFFLFFLFFFFLFFLFFFLSFLTFRLSTSFDTDSGTQQVNFIEKFCVKHVFHGELSVLALWVGGQPQMHCLILIYKFIEKELLLLLEIQ